MTYLTYFVDLFVCHAAWPIAVILSSRYLSEAIIEIAKMKRQDEPKR